MRKLAKANRPLSLVNAQGVPLVPKQRVLWTVGARPGDEQYEDHVYLRIGDTEARMTADQAEEIAVQLRNFAIEVRNGGSLDGGAA